MVRERSENDGLSERYRHNILISVAVNFDLRDLTDETLEWQLANEQVGGLLVPTDLTEGDSSWAVSVK